MTRVNIKSGDQLKTGDTEPDLVAELYKDNGNPKDLSSGSPTVEFALVEVNEDNTVIDDDTSGRVSITDAPNGEVTYQWQDGDTDKKGTYEGEFRVVDGAQNESFPNRGTFNIHIEEGLN
jgi:hypothetical protein